MIGYRSISWTPSSMTSLSVSQSRLPTLPTTASSIPRVLWGCIYLVNFSSMHSAKEPRPWLSSGKYTSKQKVKDMTPSSWHEWQCASNKGEQKVAWIWQDQGRCTLIGYEHYTSTFMNDITEYVSSMYCEAASATSIQSAKDQRLWPSTSAASKKSEHNTNINLLKPASWTPKKETFMVDLKSDNESQLLLWIGICNFRHHGWAAIPRCPHAHEYTKIRSRSRFRACPGVLNASGRAANSVFPSYFFTIGQFTPHSRPMPVHNTTGMYKCSPTKRYKSRMYTLPGSRSLLSMITVPTGIVKNNRIRTGSLLPFRRSNQPGSYPGGS